jgi:membrane protease YdiL (CAAX protease family)
VTLLVPLLVMLLGHVGGRIATRLASQRWAWLAPTLAYWVSMMVAIAVSSAPLSAWFAAPAGPWGWAGLAIGIGAAHLSFLALNLRALRSSTAVAVWLLFALINGSLEELFWRGLVLHGLGGWAPWAAVVVTSLLFAVNHPITFGRVSPSLRHPVTVVAAFCMGLGWSWVSLQTGSLLWPVVGHVLTNLGAMAGPVFLGLVVPPIGQKRKLFA